MENNKLFARALRLKLRFEYRGIITTEDLWDLSLPELDTVYSKVATQIKESDETSLLQKQNSRLEELKLKAEVIKYVFTSKQSEAKAKTAALAERQAKERELAELERAIQEKITASYAELSLEELEAKKQELLNA